MLTVVVPFLVAIRAGTRNALAGGGSFVTFPALLLAGMDARAASITSTIALVPGQLATGWARRSRVTGTPDLSFPILAGPSLAGGTAVGAILGGQLGAWMLLRVNERTLRACIVPLGLGLTVGPFLRLP